MKHGLRMVAVLAVLGLVAAACAQDEDGGGGDTGPAAGLGAVTVAAGEPIRIATLQSNTGDTASLGIDQERAVEIAIADRGGELLGHPIELQKEDDGCDAAVGTTAAQKIVADPQIVGIVGTSCSGAAVPASEIMSEAGLTMISGSNTSAILTAVGPTEGPAHQDGYFRTAHNDGLQSEAAATFVFNDLGLQNVAYLHDGDPYTQGLADGFGAFFEEQGGTVTLATAVNKGDTDMRPVLTEVVESGAELLYFPIFQPEGDFIVKQCTEVEGCSDLTLMGADGLLSDTFVSIKDTEGMYFSGPSIPETAAYTDFVAKYEEAYGEKPIQSFHAQAYDATNILLDAIEGAATEQDDGSLVIDRQAIRDAVQATSGVDGVASSYTCNEFGDCTFPKIDVVQNTPDQQELTDVRANVLYTFDPAAA